MTDLERVASSAPVTVDIDTLKYLGYDPNNVATRALVLLAHRYQLDPLLGEIQLIADSKGRRLYVTRDGMLAVAHASGHLDGIVVAEQRRNSTGDGWTCYVEVWRNDMAHPFRYGAQCKDSEPQARAGNGPEMALARAERRALKRAFRIRSDFYPERPEIEEDDTDTASPTAVGVAATVEGPAREEPQRSPAPALVPDEFTPVPDEFIVPTREQDAQLRRLRIQLGLMPREEYGRWQMLLARALGRDGGGNIELNRNDADRAIAFLTEELAAQAQAIADARRKLDSVTIDAPSEILEPEEEEEPGDDGNDV